MAQLFSLATLRAMKSTFIVFAFTLLLTSCSRPDARLAKQIVGTWTEYGTGWTNTFDFASDGSFVAATQKPSETHSSAGVWQVRDGVLIETFTNASNVSHPIDAVVRYRIIAVDSHKFMREYVSPSATTTLSR